MGGVTDAVGVGEGLEVGEGVRDGEGVREGDAVCDGEGVDVSVAVRVGPVGETEGDAEGVREGDREGVAEEDAVGVTVNPHPKPAIKTKPKVQRAPLIPRQATKVDFLRFNMGRLQPLTSPFRYLKTFNPCQNLTTKPEFYLNPMWVKSIYSYNAQFFTELAGIFTYIVRERVPPNRASPTCSICN